MKIVDVQTALNAKGEDTFLDLVAMNGHHVGAANVSGVSPVWEMHPDTDELFYVLDGVLQLTLLEANGPHRYEAPAGSVFSVPRGVWHKPAAPGGARFLYLTPGDSLHSDAEDPRAAPAVAGKPLTARVVAAGREHRDDWLRLRRDFWPDEDDEHAPEIDAYLGGAAKMVDQAYLFVTPTGRAEGLIELRVRNYAEGSMETEVPFVEGWFIAAEWRGRGAGRALMARAEQWARELGKSELASDCLNDNHGSIAAHLAMGFEETERIVCWLKNLDE